MYFMRLILLLFPIFVFSQAEPNFVFAKSKKEAGVGKEFLYDCNLNILDFVKENDDLMVYGYYQCKIRDTIDFYKVFWNDKTYKIKTTEVNISEEDHKYISSLDSINQAKLLSRLHIIVKNKKEELLKKIKEQVNQYKAKGEQCGLILKKSEIFDQSEYTEGTGYRITLANMSKKTIKYIWISVKGINPVDDPVSVKTLKCIGPINAYSEGSYSFDYVWMTDVVEKFKLISIKIQYMDGSFKQIQKPDELVINEELYDLFFEYR